MPQLTEYPARFGRALRQAATIASLAALAVAVAPAPAAERFERGLLWRIEGGGAPASHVFGTIHIDDPQVTKLPPPVERELKDAGSLTLEVGLDASNLLALASRMLFSDGRDLPGVAGADLYGKLAGVMAGQGVPEPVVRMLKPWVAAMLLSAPPQDTDNVLDVILGRMAAAQNKPVHELETLDEQVAVFEGLAEADQVALLKRAVDEHALLARTVARLIEAYLARDLAALWRISEESGSGRIEAARLNEVLSRRLLVERNTRMAERMQARLEEGNAFIAIGALHLYGERGVLAALERRGYRVTRVY